MNVFQQFSVMILLILGLFSFTIEKKHKNIRAHKYVPSKDLIKKQEKLIKELKDIRNEFKYRNKKRTI